jgi:hypothetical protein
MLYTRTWYRLNWMLYEHLSADWASGRLSRFMAAMLAKYAGYVFAPYFRATSVFGFALLLNMVTQM